MSRKHLNKAFVTEYQEIAQSQETQIAGWASLGRGGEIGQFVKVTEVFVTLRQW